MSSEATTEWLDRWRVVRRASPDCPSPELFDVLRNVPDSAIGLLAEASGDDPELLRWWSSVADDPARDELARLRMSQVPVYRALRDAGPFTDDELVAYVGRKKSEIGPRRVELVRLGLIQEVEKRVTHTGRKAAAWGVVPADEMETARGLARQRGPRRKHLDKYTLEEKVQIVQYLVGKDDVNQALLEDRKRSRAKDRGRREANALRAERDRARRDLNERIRQAERDASPQLVFLKAVALLRRAADAVTEMDRVVYENIEAQLAFGTPDISPEDWPEVLTELDRLIENATSARSQLRDFLDDAEVIDVNVFEDVDILEIEAGQDDNNEMHG